MPQVASSSRAPRPRTALSNRCFCFSVCRSAPVCRVRRALVQRIVLCDHGVRGWLAARGADNRPSRRLPGAPRGTDPCTATASGISSVVAVLKPVNPSIATTSMVSRHASSRSASQLLNAFLERPSTMSSSRAGPVPSRIGVRSMITVTYLSPRRVCRQLLIHADDLHVVEAVRIVYQDPAALGQDRVVGGVPRDPQSVGDPSDTQVLTHHPFQRPPQATSRQLRPRLGSPRSRPGATRARTRCTGLGDADLQHRGRHPNRSCANRRTTVSLAAPWHPQRRHHLSGSTTRHRRIARSSSNRCPSTSSPRSSRRANVVRSERAKVASDTSRSSRWTA